MNRETKRIGERQLRYLTRVLALNPIHKSDAIIAARSHFLGIKPRNSQVVATERIDLRELRNKNVAKIEATRQKFWSMKIDRLRKGLGSLDLNDFPELKNAAGRLMTVARNRHEMARLAEHRDFDSRFFSSLKQILVKSPRDAAVIKEEVFEDLTNPTRLKKTRRMILAIQHETPELYDLESDWFEMIRDLKRRKKKSSRSKTEPGFFWFEGVGWVGWVLLVFVLRLIHLMVRAIGE